MSSARFSIPDPAPAPARRARRASRRERLRRGTLEALEPRTLLATLPVAVATGQIGLSTSSQTSDESDPIIAIDPTDPQRLVSVWTRHDTAFQAPVQEVIGGAFSVNGGRSWSNFDTQIGFFPDPATSNPVQPFGHTTTLGVDVDRAGNVYVLGIQYSDGFNSGVVFLSRYVLDTSGPVPSLQAADPLRVLREWNRSDNTAPQRAYRDGALVIDDTLPSFTDPTTGQTVTNPNSGNVYVTLLADSPNPANANPFNPFTVELSGSKDRGVTFSGDTTLGAGNFSRARESLPRITVSQGTADGRIEPGRLTAVFLDTATGDNFAPLPQDLIYARPISVDSSGATPTFTLRTRRVVATTNILAADTVDGAGQTANPANPAFGFTASPVIASDNTLGSFSPNQGRLYIAYVDRLDILRDAPFGNGNPATNTDIFLAFSDDGGGSWSSPRKVNDDFSLLDGKTQSFDSPQLTTGRLQFMPEVAVDQATGTLVMTWRDARDDASGVRVATYLTTSINGGSTFSDQTFVNAAQAPFDVATRRNVVLGPVPDNQSAGNPEAEPVIGFGTRMGLAVSGGRAYPAWSGNFNGGPRGLNHLDVLVASTGFGGGPRVVASTMGRIVGRSVARLSDHVRLDFNNRFNADGVPIADGLIVTFDRPIDPTSFSASDVLIRYRDPNTPGTDPGVTITPTSVTPIDSADGNNPGVTAFERAFGATQFLVRFPGNSGVGTYTYSVGPNIADRIRTVTTAGSSTGNPMDQDADGIEGEAAAGPVFAGFDQGDVYNAPDPDGGLDPRSLGASLPLSIPGAHLVSEGVRYDAKPSQVELEIPDAVGASPGVLLSTITIGGDTNLQVTDLDVAVTISYARASDLRVFLIAPDGTQIPLAIRPNGASGFDGTVFDDQAARGIAANSPAPRPLIGRFQPTSALFAAAGQTLAGTWTLRIEDAVPDPANPNVATGVLEAWALIAKSTPVYRDATADRLTIKFDRDMDFASLNTGNHVLRLLGPTGLIPGPFQIVLRPNLDPNYPDPDPAHPRTYQILLPSPALSGSYVARLSADVKSEDGLLLDSNQDAGLDNLRGVPTLGTVPITYFSSDAVPIGGAAAGAIFESPIVVPDNFLIQDVAVQINISFPNDPALRASLIAPDGTVIQLFANLPVPGANFRDTIFDDRAPTPITNAGPPYSGRFSPQPGAFGQTLGNLAGMPSLGTWRLQVQVDVAGTAGTIDSWRLTLAQPVSTDGLGDNVTDRADLEFRSFILDPTNPLASSTWTAVGPAGIGAKGPNLNAEVAGRINTVELDPSDPSGNTAFAATPGGGVWKSTNFLTQDPSGPTWLPLLDDAPILGMNVSDLALFPRNNDPNQTVVFALTGDSDALGDPLRQAGRTSRGVGFLRSDDGGRTWVLLDSLNNNLDFTSRDHFFASARGQAGVSGYRLIVDPNPVQSDPSRIVLFAAISDVNADGMAVASGPKGGVYRSNDSGQTWQRVRAGQATDVLFDPSSQSPDLVLGTPPNQIVRPGNLQFLYAAFRGDGVYFSPNAGDVFNPVLGTTGDPLIQNADGPQPLPVPVANPSTPPTPNSGPLPLGQVANGGRIVLAKPEPTGNALQDLIYRGYLYAAVVQNLGVQEAPISDFIGLYQTKDFGQNWTKLDVTAFDSRPFGFRPFLPTNDPTAGADFSITGSGTRLENPFHLGRFDLSLSVDPLNPNVVYLGGTSEFQSFGLMRVDATGAHDAHAFYLDNLGADGGLRMPYVTAGGVTTIEPDRGLPFLQPPFDPRLSQFLNFIRDPGDPFRAGATILVTNTSQFVNDGAGVLWTPFDRALAPDPFANPRFDPFGVPTRGVHRITTLRDPLTGLSRLIFSTNQGVYSVVADRDGTLVGSAGGVGRNANTPPRGDVGDVKLVSGTRNGNLQLAQFYEGASQPSQLSAQLAVLRGYFYGSSETVGTSWSDPEIIQRLDTQTGVLNSGYGNLSWIGGPHRGPSRGDIATQQELELDVFGNPILGGAVYNYRSSEGLLADDGRPSTDTFQVNAVARTFGLYQTSGTGDTPDPQFGLRGGYSFAVNPLNGDQAVIGSQAGRIFATLNRGLIWSEIGNPGALDNSPATAITYGAPAVGSSSVLQLDDYVIVGTLNGGIYVTFTGGGTGGGAGNAFLARNDGLDGTPVRDIVTDPTRGSFRAYAVTEAGVYLMRDTRVGGTWENITGNLFGLTFNPLGGSDADADTRLKLLASLAVDFRYVIPDDFAAPTGPAHPALYVGGEGGVYRSLDNGQTWAGFPETGLLNSPLPLGGLPNSRVTDLDLALGNIDPQTGRPNSLGAENSGPLRDSRGPNVLTATTYGRGQFTIRLAPIVFPNSDATPGVLSLSTTPRPDSITPAATIISDTGLSNTDGVTNQTRPFVTGFSEQTAFGNFVRISLFDLTDPANPVLIGGFDPTDPDTDTAANRTSPTGTFAVQVNPDVYATDGSTDGLKTIGVQATNLSGTQGNIATFQFILDTVRPEPAGPLDLISGFDTGLRNDDEITNPNMLADPATGTLGFNVGFDADPTGVDTQAVLLRTQGSTTQAVGTAVLGLDAVTLLDLGPLTEGVSGYKVRLTDLAGNVSEDSPALNVRVDRTRPGTPGTPAIEPADDTGTPGDNITANRRPFLRGTGEANSFTNPNEPAVRQNNQVRLIDSTGQVIGTGSVIAGTYRVQPTNPLANGVYVFRVVIVDVAGNVSDPSSQIVLEIRNLNVTPPTLRLVPDDDSGFVGDNVTNVQRPRLQGTGESGRTIQILDVGGNVPDGALPPSAIIGQDGNYLVQFAANLPGGTYTLRARAIDLGSGSFADSPILTLRIIPQGTGSGPAPSLRLNPGDDTGTKGDGITSLRVLRLIGQVPGVTPGNNVAVALFQAGVATTPGTELDRTTTDNAGNFTLRPATNLSNGTIRLVARTVDAAGNYGPASPIFTLRLATTIGDYNADGLADLAGYNRTSGNFSIGFTAAPGGIIDNLGQTGGSQVPIQADFDGDGRNDYGVVDFNTGTWRIRQSQLGLLVRQFGAARQDLPVPGDYDGDGRADFAVFNPDTATWRILFSAGGALVRQFGEVGVDQPNPADYDGDGRIDLGVFRATDALWRVALSGGGVLVRQFGRGSNFGLLDRPTPADFDGDGKADLAVFRPESTARFLALASGGGPGVNVALGTSGDIPVPQDYDNDGKADPAILRNSAAFWQYVRSTDNQTISRNFGPIGDLAIGAPLFPYRLPAFNPSSGGPGNPTSPGDPGRAFGFAASPGNPGGLDSRSFNAGGLGSDPASSSLSARQEALARLISWRREQSRAVSGPVVLAPARAAVAQSLPSAGLAFGLATRRRFGLLV